MSSPNMNTLKRCLADLRFTNSFTHHLIADARTAGEPFARARTPSPFAHTPRQVLSAHFSYVEPEPAPDPVLISVSKPCGEVLGLDLEAILADEREKDRFIGFVSGRYVPEGTNPWSMAYAGHQFGSWAGQLGDGRAICLGEVTTEAEQRWEVQLKGAGLTPFSRFADGYAVLRSSIREYLCSEAMFHLGVPTTRALSLVGSSRRVQRETEETGAVVCRLAPTWVRFGNFELFLSRGDIPNLRLLADWVIAHHFPHLAAHPTKYSAWLTEVTHRTAKTIAKWQSVGFCHGVLNTDNMSILGLTLDYGPFQFMDAYDPQYVCNHSDHTGRYAFDAQPGVGLWNVAKLASAVSPLVVDEENGDKSRAEDKLKEVLQSYAGKFHEEYMSLMTKKLGLMSPRPEDVETLVKPLLAHLATLQADYTHFFRSLSTGFTLAQSDSKPPLSEPLEEWYNAYRTRLLSELDSQAQDVLVKADMDRMQRMKAANPKYILRNHLAQQVIDKAEKGDYGDLEAYFKVLQRPFEDGSAEEGTKFAGSVPSWAKGLKCSCSS
ncbi:uncharacterized protein SPPG_05830 [Spizellomyces punctatus DAOM BR117]|uniref:Selenoprotein O n=2 Tax=Spizellomyces punctatus (strain DAOM BR117) TaxID=645134 RepID=A0A0L0HCX5_SPIPD|nr:uncharacterized protein SPPG_05830 [Spizellomyces punctatus DAOM BR117]KNC98861.1 hypothetical protein SPPG_05830 [Spizellomyces punctatus DAOM BR117]|eukprot:XP_016606901.1 hypothetical protein SPPG_05830 [Spizellomyces punctatus DAOM BR117]